MTDLALNVSVQNSAKEYAIKKPVTESPSPEEQSAALKGATRESGLNWLENENSGLSLSDQLFESEYLLSTSTTTAAVKAAQKGLVSQEMLQELKNKFKRIFMSSYGNIFSHNRLLAKVSEWMVGNVMERLALLGLSMGELEEMKSSVRTELVQKNQTAMEQVVYDETMLEILA